MNTHLANIIESNLTLLSSITTLIDTLSQEQFIKVNVPCFSASFGKHLRHIVDHYLCFQRDFSLEDTKFAEHSCINYDLRTRNVQLEYDKKYALVVLLDIENYLKALKSSVQSGKLGNSPLFILLCSDAALPQGQHTRSFLERELQFLHGHTIHHFALMAVILRLQNIDVDKNFGMAPSTIQYQNCTDQQTVSVKGW